MIHILYLAAGQARRFGSNKLLASYEGKPLYRHGFDAIREAIREREDCTLNVVTCWDEIAASVTEDGVRCILCPDSAYGRCDLLHGQFLRSFLLLILHNEAPFSIL